MTVSDCRAELEFYQYIGRFIGFRYCAGNEESIVSIFIEGNFWPPLKYYGGGCINLIFIITFFPPFIYYGEGRVSFIFIDLNYFPSFPPLKYYWGGCINWIFIVTLLSPFIYCGEGCISLIFIDLNFFPSFKPLNQRTGPSTYNSICRNRI